MKKHSNTSVSSIDRREAIKWIIGGSALITATVIAIHNRLPIPRIYDTTRTIGERAVPIPNSWHRTLERISIDATELGKEDIDTLTKSMQPIDYNRVCNSNPSAVMQATKYGMSLPDVISRLPTGRLSSSGLVRVESTDWYTLVHDDANKVFLSISKTNIPKKYWHGKDFESARKAKMTYPGIFFPEEKAQAWKDLVDVNNIYSPDEDVKPGTYFKGPDGRIIMPKHHDVSMTIDDLILVIGEPGRLPLRIYYSDFREIAEANFIMYQKKEYPYIPIKELLEYGQIEQKDVALVLHANNYSVSIPPWRQDKLGIILDDKYEKKYGVPTKLIGGEFLNKAAQIGGVYRIEAVPMNT